jgi:hypothetical protein
MSGEIDKDLAFTPTQREAGKAFQQAGWRLETKPTTVAFGSRLRSREIADGDVETLAKFLGRGLGYPSQYFLQILNRLAEHPTPTGFPRYGHVLEKEERIVGAILLIFSAIWSDDAPTVDVT